MPELPEVETIRRELAPRVVGRRINEVEIRWPGIIARVSPDIFRQRVQGACVTDMGRRGKYLLWTLEPEGTVIVHLRMTGQLHHHPSPVPADKHTHLIMRLDDGSEVHYRDVRKFGRWYWTSAPEEVVGHLGPEPLSPEWTVEEFAAALGRRRRPIKALLLDQRVVAGLGNIYADEALFVAGIHPLRRGDTLRVEEVRRLHEAIRQVLLEALHAGGSTFSTYQRPDMGEGTYQRRHRVFRRTGHPCPVCGTPIERIRVSGRSTHFCPHCQR